MTGMRTMFAGPMVLPTALLLLGGIAYGSLFSANKMAIGAGFPFLAYSFWQVLLAAAALLLLSVFTSGLPRLSIVNLRVFALVSVAGLIGPLLVITAIADKLPPGVVTLCAALIPAVTYILALTVRSDRLRWMSTAGVLLGFGSMLLIVLPRESLPVAGSWVWVVFSLLMPLSAAVNNVFGAMLRPADAGSVSMSAGMMGMAAVILFFISWANDGLFLLTDAGPEGLWGTLWAAAAIAVTYTCFFEIIRRAGGLFFAQLNYVVVAAGLIWAWILFGESLSGWVWGAVAVLVASLAFINAGTARSIREREAAAAASDEGGSGAP